MRKITLNCVIKITDNVEILVLLISQHLTIHCKFEFVPCYQNEQFTICQMYILKASAHSHS